MADGPDKHSKTEAASQHKLKKSREQGQVAKSQDLSGTIGIIVAMIMFGVMSPQMAYGLNQLFHEILFDFNFEHVAPHGINYIMIYSVESFVRLCFPMLIVIWLAATIATIAQVGFTFSVKPLEPKFDKINPVKGMQKLFSKRGIVSTTISATKMLVIAVIAGSVLMNKENTLVLMNLYDISFVISKAHAIIWELTMKAAITLLIIGVIDYAYQKWQFLEDQKMTKHEVKEELKEHEGNPTIKSKVKSLQKATAQRRGLKENVAEADVIVTNPFHIAVAIKYDREESNAPIIVAKGARLLAERIKKFAREANVEIIQNIPLARALYKRCNTGFEIPPDLYVAVAEVLAIIFRKKNKNLVF